MYERHFDAQWANKLANHPSIFPYICGSHKGPFDLSAVIANTNNVCLAGEFGTVLFIQHQPGIYEFHTNVLPEGRGAWMVKSSQFAFNWMFTKTDAYELITECPQGNVSARAGARAVGCTHVFTTRPIWSMGDELVSVDVCSILIQHWIKNAKGISAIGKWFHNNLENQYKILGRSLETHAEDEEHDRYVGAAMEMIRSGYIFKAITFYNRWAILARYKPINLVSLDPLVIDINDCKLRIDEDDFKVI